MAFELYLAGAEKKTIMDYLLEVNNMPKLFNQLSERNQISTWIEAIRKGSYKRSLFIDSGAYLTYTAGKQVNVDDYIDYVNANMDAITVFAQVDKIPGEFKKLKTEAQIKEAPEMSWENYLYMRDRVKNPDKLLPVFHRREDFKWLRKMLEWTDGDGEHIPYIAIAPTTDSSTSEKNDWFDRVFAIIKDSPNPQVKTHAFGVTNLKLLEKYPIYSADSTTWLRSAAFGNIVTKWGDIVVSGVLDKRKKHINHQPMIKKETLENYVADFGFDIKDLIYNNAEKNTTARDCRIMFNATYFKYWSDNYVYKGGNSFKKSLF